MLSSTTGVANLNVVAILPVFNEEVVLRKVVHVLVNQVSAVIVVDDGSSEPVINHIGDLPVIVLRHQVNLGQGAALQTGFAYARKLNPDIVITFDGDGQHDANDLAGLIAPIVQGKSDIVLGSRFLPDSATRLSFAKKMILQLARYINFLLSGILLSDAHNGLRALNPTALEKITITENRMAHASEILFQIKKHRLRYMEVPVHIRYTNYSIKKGQSVWDSIKVFFDIVLHKMFK
jgi:glycosyltransferase involved in cell wall biosynthesis